MNPRTIGMKARTTGTNPRTIGMKARTTGIVAKMNWAMFRVIGSSASTPRRKVDLGLVDSNLKTKVQVKKGQIVQIKLQLAS